MGASDGARAWKAKAARAREAACVAGVVELEKYPNIDEILSGYVNDDGEVIKGGSLLVFVSGQGKLTACLNLPGGEQQFWTDVAFPDGIFAELEESIVSGRGSFKVRSEPRDPKKKK
jgi:hypothetical protein